MLRPPMNLKSSMRVQPVQPPRVNAPQSSWNKFKSWLKDNRVISGSLGALSRLEILNKYKDYLIAGSEVANKLGYGKKKRKSKMIKDPNQLCSCIHQFGGSWGDFVGWIKDRANDVANVGRKVGNKIADAGKFVYNRALKPAYNFAKEKPLTTMGYVTKGLSYLPTPFSAPLSTASTALGTAGTLLGRGQEGGSRKGHSGKVLAIF
jgi:hypothetical protein